MGLTPLQQTQTTTGWIVFVASMGLGLFALYVGPRFTASDALHGHLTDPVSLRQFSAIEVPSARPDPVVIGANLSHQVWRQFGEAAILRLFLASRPAAIRTLVMSIAVVPLQRHTGWARTHIGQKGLEVHPPLTDRDASPTVVFVAVRAWIGAAVFHVHPSEVFGTTTAIAPVAVTEI